MHFLPVAIFADVPVWALAAILIVLTLNVIWIFRDWQQGFAYDTAYSSQLGSVAFVTIILIAATIVQRGAVPAFLNETAYQAALALLGVGFGTIWFGIDPPSQLGDRYHRLIVTPLFFFLLTNSAVIIFSGGSRGEKVIAIALFLAWAFMCARDWTTQRINQRTYLERRGIHFWD